MSNEVPAPDHSAESDAIPETVGYREPFTEIEYGVFVDRRRFGHGFMLLRTTKSPSAAQEYAERAVGSRDDAAQIGAEDVHIRARRVTLTPWSPPITSPASMNERDCDGSFICDSGFHIHGCYADRDGAACDDPDDHTTSPATTDGGEDRG